jgi:hypothetical protein
MADERVARPNPIGIVLVLCFALPFAVEVTT